MDKELILLDSDESFCTSTMPRYRHTSPCRCEQRASAWAIETSRRGRSVASFETGLLMGTDLGAKSKALEKSARAFLGLDIKVCDLPIARHL